MKRSLTLVLFIIAIFSVCVFSSSAVQEFTDNGLTFAVPDILKNDADWAESNDYSYAFCDDQECMELCVSVYPNDGFTYAGMDEESLANYASSMEEYFSNQGQNWQRSPRRNSCQQAGPEDCHRSRRSACCASR